MKGERSRYTWFVSLPNLVFLPAVEQVSSGAIGHGYPELIEIIPCYKHFPRKD